MRAYRTDIDGLRALAVTSVVLFHCQVPGFDWGFVGVDVFYVISGFLISAILLRDTEEHGRPRLARFWARRIRRLLPASTAVVLFTGAAAVLWMSPARFAKIGGAMMASTFYVSNVFFARQSTNYFLSDDLEHNPLMHTWSLSVEEQFYVGWPLLFLVGALVSKRFGRRALPILLGTVTLVSLALALVLTRSGSPWAFFSMPTRAWQFAVGGLLGIAQAGTLPSARVGFTAAVVALVGTFGAVDGVVAYPGLYALLPTVATLGLLLAGPGLPWLTRGLSHPVLRFIGTRSYGWYLWHWPALILLYDTMNEPTLTARLAVGVASLGAADLSYRWLENPVRHAPALNGRPWRNFALAGSLAVVSLGAALGVQSIGAKRMMEPAVAHWVDQIGVPLRWTKDQCHADAADIRARCEVGDVESDRTVLVMGDSHAGHWEPALRVAGVEQGFKVWMATGHGCPAIDVPIRADRKRRDLRCAKHRVAMDQVIRDLKPDVVLLGQFHTSASEERLDVAETSVQEAWTRGMRMFASSLAEQDIELVVVLDVPMPARRPVHCLTHTADPRACDVYGEPRRRVEQVHAWERDALERAGHGSVYAPTDALCDEERCRVSVDGGLVYSDRNHLTGGYVLTHAKPLGDLLDRRLQASRHLSPDETQ